MAREGASGASALSPDGLSIPMAFTAIALYFASDVFVHGGRLNAEACHHDRKRGGYHCHRDGGASSRTDAASTNSPAPPWIAPAGASRYPGAFANCAEARAVGAAQMRRGEPGYGPHRDRDGDGVGCGGGEGDAGAMLM